MSWIAETLWELMPMKWRWDISMQDAVSRSLVKWSKWVKGRIYRLKFTFRFSWRWISPTPGYNCRHSSKKYPWLSHLYACTGIVPGIGCSYLNELKMSELFLLEQRRVRVNPPKVFKIIKGPDERKCSHWQESWRPEVIDASDGQRDKSDMKTFFFPAT